MQWVDVGAEHAGQRVDNFLLARLKGVPKSRIYRILRKGEVRINKSRVKPEYKLKQGDKLRIPPVRVAERPELPKPSQSLTLHLNQSILLETDGFMVINKPSGLAVHGGDGVNLGLIEALRQIRSDCPYLELAHRLDKETSGCVLIAKKRSTLKALQDIFRSPGGIDKRYWALAVGHWPEKCIRVDQPLQRLELPDGNRIVKVRADGKPSVTEFQVVERFNIPQVGPLTLVQAMPKTGRTHQIRVHAQYAGYPLVGDSKYGVDEVNRQIAALASLRLCLHAQSLRFTLAGVGAFEVEAPVLPDWNDLIAKLRSIN